MERQKTRWAFTRECQRNPKMMVKVNDLYFIRSQINTRRTP
jgi:hypothetical protein